ncbi:MAG: TetR/AcrR family transcriptional regulator [Clostridia bacterium]|nr:TetR/AcrR family transcriptional regulator [Clostridia bacterium]
MDKRVEKTKYAIKNAFMELRRKKSLEKITVKELCELAYINKSTFYSHYEDIYALSDAVEYEIVLEIISSIPKDLDYNFSNPEVFTREVTLAFARYMPQIKLIFSGKSQTHLAIHLEAIIKKMIFAKYPEGENNTEMNILLSYCIHGAYNASLSNPNADQKTIIQVLEKVTKALQPLY